MTKLQEEVGGACFEHWEEERTRERGREREEAVGIETSNYMQAQATNVCRNIKCCTPFSAAAKVSIMHLGTYNYNYYYFVHL